jgi:NitT/TauT family transport system substrate-binding protein
VLVDHFFQPMALFRTALRLQGVDETKVRFLDAGDVASIEAAFRRGEGDFVHLQGPAPQQLEADGVGRVVASVGQATGDLAFSSLCAQPAWLGTDVARAFVRAYRRERQAAQSHPAHDLAKRIGRYLPESDPGVLAKTIADYQRMETWAGSEVITPELFNATVEVFLAVGHMAAKPALADVLAPLPTV